MNHVFEPFEITLPQNREANFDEEIAQSLRLPFSYLQFKFKRLHFWIKFFTKLGLVSKILNVTCTILMLLTSIFSRKMITFISKSVFLLLNVLVDYTTNDLLK